MLGRIDQRSFPTLAEMTGDPGAPEAVEQPPEQMAHNFRLWRAVLRLRPSPESGDLPPESGPHEAADGLRA